MIIYSGCTAGCTPISNDVWVLSNANGLGGTPTWTVLSTAGIAPGRNNHKAAYDPSTNRMLMFGGQDGGGFLSTVFEEVWVLTNANGLEAGTPTWSLIAPMGAPASGTIGYYIGAIVYDSAANRMTVFGGAPKTPPAVSTDRNSVWVLSNANGLGGTPAWTNTVAQDAAGSPPNQAGGAFVNNTASNIVTLYNFIGSPAIPRTWTLSHANGLDGPSEWTEMFPGGGSPGAPHLNSYAYAPPSNRMMVFTNRAIQTNTNEVWVLSDTTTTTTSTTTTTTTSTTTTTTTSTTTSTTTTSTTTTSTATSTTTTTTLLPPARPGGVTALPGDSQATISWGPAVFAFSYNLYMASASGVTAQNYATLPEGMQHTGVSNPYTHTGLTNGTTYYFVVTAVNNAGESAESDEVSATPYKYHDHNEHNHHDNNNDHHNDVAATHE